MIGKADGHALETGSLQTESFEQPTGDTGGRGMDSGQHLVQAVMVEFEQCRIKEHGTIRHPHTCARFWFAADDNLGIPVMAVHVAAAHLVGVFKLMGGVEQRPVPHRGFHERTRTFGRLSLTLCRIAPLIGYIGNRFLKSGLFLSEYLL